MLHLRGMVSPPEKILRLRIYPDNICIMNGSVRFHLVQQYLETGELLGEVVRPILLQYGVQAFILGGQISKSFSLMEPGLRQALAGLGQLKYIAAAEDIDNVHLYGAALA